MERTLGCSKHLTVAKAAVQLLKRVDEPWARDAVESAQMMNDF